MHVFRQRLIIRMSSARAKKTRNVLKHKANTNPCILVNNLPKTYKSKFGFKRRKDGLSKKCGDIVICQQFLELNNICTAGPS